MTVSLVEPEARANRAGSGFVLSSTASSTASDDDDARSTASGYSDAVSVAARRASAEADQGAGTMPVLKFTGSSLENLRESLNLSNDTNDAISILPDGQLRLEFANPDGGEGSDDPP